MKNINFVTLFIIVLTVATFGQIPIDIYLPSLPFVSRSLNCSDHLAQLTISAYVVGFGISPLAYGPLSDYYGRRNPLIAGLSIGMIGGFICLFSYSIYVLLAGRLIQGLGTGVCITSSRSILRDVYEGPQLAKINSHLITGRMFLMTIAPIIGGYIQTYFNWRGNFIALSSICFLLIIFVVLKLPETNGYIKHNNISISQVKNDYLILLKNRMFLRYIVCIGLSYAGILSYFTIGPTLLQNVVGLTPMQFSWAHILVCSAFAVGGIVNSFFVTRFNLTNMIMFGSIIMTFSGFIMMLFCFFEIISAISILLPVAIFIIGYIFVFANALAGALTPFPHTAGAASSLARSVQLLLGIIISIMLTMFFNTTQFLLSTTYVLLGCSCIFLSLPAFLTKFYKKLT